MTKIICSSRHLQLKLKEFLKTPLLPQFEEEIKIKIENKRLTVESEAYRAKIEMDVETRDGDDIYNIDIMKIMALEKLLRFVQHQPLVLNIKYGEFVIEHIAI